jgi:hypothetical protein
MNTANAMSVDGEILAEFNPTSDSVVTLRDLIRTQAGDVCRSEIGAAWIRASVDAHHFGFARFVPRAQIGRRVTQRSGGDRFFLWGFVLCTLSPARDIVNVELVCARQGAPGTGRMLMEMVEQKSRDIHARLITLKCLPRQRLKSYYESLGFQCVERREFNSNEKVYDMFKFL